MNKVKVSEHISANLSLTPEGFLVCKNVPLSHTGAMEYHYRELMDFAPEGFPLEKLKCDDEGFIKVYKPAAVLFSVETMASFENKPVTVNHKFVNTKNSNDVTVGHAFNVRQGVGALEHCLLADLFITNHTAIDLIRSGELREISLGYDAEFAVNDQGECYQSSMIGNHIAIVSQGRAGDGCRIYDSMAQAQEEIGEQSLMQTFTEMLKRILASELEKDAAAKGKGKAKDEQATSEQLAKQGDATDLEQNNEQTTAPSKSSEESTDTPPTDKTSEGDADAGGQLTAEQVMQAIKSIAEALMVLNQLDQVLMNATGQSAPPAGSNQEPPPSDADAKETDADAPVNLDESDDADKPVSLDE